MCGQRSKSDPGFSVHVNDVPIRSIGIHKSMQYALSPTVEIFVISCCVDWSVLTERTGSRRSHMHMTDDVSATSLRRVFKYGNQLNIIEAYIYIRIGQVTGHLDHICMLMLPEMFFVSKTDTKSS
mmetsp:Transcript_36977/g.46285  ORF Transcript_36977/g.46285 Transcript_36977/m.46285 type:complete len:125 (+) Transcript_36977:339-713(+)